MKNLSRRMKRMLAILLVETIVAVNVISSYASDADGVMTFSEEEVSEMAENVETGSEGETSDYSEPVTEEPVYEEPVYEEPVYEEPAEEAPQEETPQETPVVEEELQTEEPIAEEPSPVNEDAVPEEEISDDNTEVQVCICTQECDYKDLNHLNSECPVCEAATDIENDEEREAYLEEHCKVVKENLAKATPVPTEIPEATASPTATLEPTAMPVDPEDEDAAPTPSASISPDASASASATPSAEADTSADPDESPSVSPSADASVSPSMSPSASPSVSPSISPSVSPSATPETENVTVQLTGKATQKASRWIFSKKVNMSYTVTVENTSEADATDVHVEAAIPSIITIDGETGWTIPELKAGKSTEITFGGYINENTDNVDNLMGRFYINGDKIEDVSFDGEWRLVEADTTEGPTSISTVCDGVTINVSAADGSILPAGVEVRATRISSDSAVNLIEQAQGIEVLDAMAFDIVLLVNGEEVQPDGSVVVTFSDIPLTSEDCKVSVAHLGNGGVESVTTGSQDGVSIEASHFSTYVLYTIKTVTGQYVPSNGVTTADEEDMACFDFHIFTNDYSGSYNGHVNGNFAIKNVNGDTMATFGLNNGDKVSDNQQICYVENLTAWNENVKNYSHTTFVFGPDIELKVYQSESALNIYASQNGKDYLIGPYEQMKDVVYTSEKPYVDFVEEFRKAASYSEELSAKEKDTTVSITGDNNNKYISTASTEDEVYMTMRAEDFGAQMEFNACKEGQKFIINVVADGDTFAWNSNGVIYKVNGVSSAPGNSESHAFYAGNILWNFVNPDGTPYEGTVKLTGTWLGTIMAPKATVDFTVVNGSVIADKVIKRDGESHKGTYTTTTANYTVHKSWEGGSSRPDVNIDLYRRVRNADSSFVASSIDRNNLSDTSAYEYVASATILCSKGETSYTFAKLPSSDEYGYSNEYFVVESATPGYEASYTGSLSIVNKFVEQKVGGLSVSKVNQNGMAVEGAVFGVYSDSDATVKVGEMTTNAQGIASYGELAPGTYYVKEISAPAGYKLSDAVYTVDVVENEVTKVNGGNAVVNVQEAGALTLTKVDQDKNALAGVVFTVYSDETATAPVGTMTTDAQGKASYSDLAPGTYYVKETSVPAGYRLSDTVYKVEVTADTTAEVNGGAAIVNEKEKEYTDYSVVKTWSGSSKKAVTVQLMRNGAPATDVSDYQVTLDADGDQTYKWTNLISKNGTEQYTYSVVEIDSKGNICANGTVNSDSYTVSYTNETGKTTIHNSYDSVNISGTKTWVDNDNQDGKRPESITINLLANGEKVDSKTVSASDNWNYGFTDLPKYADGKEITYTITEDAVESYTSAINGYDVTNTHTPTSVTVSGSKVWEDNGNQDGKRPENITVWLLANGKEVDHQIVKADANGNWSFSFENLPKYAGGQAIDYSVKDEVKDYTTTVEGSVDEGFTITNSYTPLTTSVSGIKTWNDQNNQDGKRPLSITVRLYADGKEVGSKVVSEADEWKWSFDNLAKYSNGKEITYTIKEDAVEGYTTLVRGYDITNSHTPETTSVRINKVWNDNSDQDGARPDTITIQLIETVAGNATVAQEKKISAATDGSWSYCFADLPVYRDGNKITYTVKETTVDRYTTTVSGSAANGFTITNTHITEKTSIEGSKVWDDSNNQDGKRPETIIVNLLANGKEVDSKSISKADDWKFSFTDLPKYADGKEISYTVEEEAVEGYSTEITGSAAAGFVITNSYTPGKTSVEGNKTWDDAENQDGKRPESITIRLLADGSEAATKTISEADGWKWSFTDLPEYKDGKKIVYTIDEVEVSGYTTKVNGYSVTNSYTPETTDISGNKTWDDAENQDGKRPENITVRLLANGTEVRSQTISAAEDGTWAYSFTGLPKYAAGEEIKYTITEDAVSGYTTAVDGYNVTNSHTPEVTSIEGSKVWDDSSNQDGKRPNFVTVRLLADGADTGKSVEVSEATGWKFSFTDLPKYAGGKEISYTVAEDSVSDYTTTISASVKTAIIITNHYTPGKTSVSGTKTWKDNDNQDGVRPESITIRLLANGVEKDHKTVGEADGWKWSFTELPEYQNGQKITYTITEDPVSDYTSAVSGYDLINTHEPATIDISGTKTWNDGDDQDGKRPESITVNLLADGTVKESRVVSAAEDGTWTYSFTGLPKYADGKEITYTIAEAPVDGYETTVDALYNISNTHNPEKVKISGTKVWEDKDNQDGVRPDSIKIHLFADGTELKDMTKTVSSADNWTWEFENLDKYADGKLINYTITEEAVANYSTVISKTGDYAYTVTNSYTPGKTSKTVVKSWDDSNDQDGIRPSEIQVVLLANGEEAKVVDAKVTLSEANNWTYTWSDLDLKAKGFAIKYTVQEITGLKDYEKPQYSYEDSVMTITNTHKPDQVYVEGVKTWEDNDNQDGLRPDSIKINLLADGVLKESKVVTAENNWSWKFDNLPKNKVENGKSVMIQYSIEEELTEKDKANYTAEYDGFDVKNIHTPEKTSISGFKKWEDNSNQDGIRPDSITVTLYADGVATAHKATVTAKDNWQFSFTGLPKYAEGKQGQEIQYTVVEDEVTGYTAEVAGSMEAGYTITNTHETTKINVSGVKVWDDEDNQDGLRPASIKVTLYANGKELTGKTAVVTASADGRWSFTFENLDKYINGEEVRYTVKEEAVNGYSTAISGNASDGILITNTHKPEKTDIAGTKSWVDGDNQDGKRPESITVNLLANGTVKESKVVSEATNWEYSFTDLDVYEGGSKITYSVEEVVPKGYTVSYDGNNITNTYNPEKTSVNGIKTWNDKDDQDGLRPTSIIVRLYADGKDTGKSVEVSAANGWKYSFENLDKFKAGKEIVYTVKEDAVAGYTTSITGYNIENIHTPEKTEVSGTKTWEDADNQDGLRPASITIRLLADGTEVQHKTVTANDNWSWSFTDLPKNKNGKEIVYTITEDAVTDYTTKIDGYHVTNSHKPAVIEISGTKTWNDADDQDGKRPEKIVVYLYADGKLTETKEVTDALGWTYSFKNLPKYKNVDGKGVEIQYTIQEAVVEEYSPTYDGYNITNSYTPEETSRTVTKLWDDGDNQDGTRPSSITVQLLANGKAYGDPVVLDKAHGWTYTWLNLPVKQKKLPVKYTVEEIGKVEGYETTYSEDTFIITNKHVPAEVYVEGVKTWDDGDDQDGLRPDSITVVLLADGVETTRMDVTPAVDGTWSWKFDKLPKFANGKQIQYSIEEIVVDGYESQADYSDGKFNLVNTHTPELIELSGSKTWNDSDDQDGMRPSSITIRLLADGVEVDSRTVTAADNWSWKFDKLPKFDNGEEIKYTVTEDAIDGYTASYTDDGMSVINSYTPEKTGRSVVKIWDDADNADQIRPAYIEVQLYADGEAYGDAVVLNDANGWSYAWTDLQAKKGGQYIVYTVQEITNVSGYTTTVTESGTTFTIVNYHPVTPPPTPTPTPPTTPPSTPPDVTPTPTTPSITPPPEVPTPTPDNNEVLGARRGGAVLGARRGLDQAVLGKRRRPTTGDSAALIVWMITLFGAMGAATVSVIGLRKKDEEK